MANTILAVVEDLFFLSKIAQTAQLLGLAVQPTDPTQLKKQILEESPAAVVLDLNRRSVPALEILRRLKADPATTRTPVLGFVSHVQVDLIAAAREAGCDTVMARSAFTQQLPQLLQKLAGTGAPRCQQTPE